MLNTKEFYLFDMLYCKSMYTLWFCNTLQGLPRECWLRLQGLYLWRCYRTDSSMWGPFSHHSPGGLQPSAATANLGTDPGLAAPLQLHGVPDCPAMWAHAGWPGQLLSTHAARCPATPAGRSLLAATWCIFSAHTHALVPNLASLTKHGSKTKY